MAALVRFPDIEPGTKVIVLVANLRPVKDVLFLLDAVDRTWTDGRDYTLVVVGCVLDYAYAAKVGCTCSVDGGAGFVVRECEGAFGAEWCVG